MELIQHELNKINSIIEKDFENSNITIFPDIKEFLLAKSKKIRPVLIFLTAKSLGHNISEDIFNLASCVELIHNATLIHDDIIDDAEKRRGKISLNKKLGNNLSVLSGDIILAIAMKKLYKCNNIKLVDIFSEALFNMCKGEIAQNSSKYKIPTLEEYIEKSKLKTAELFIAALASLCKLKNIKEEKQIINFALNYGIAFQIKDDLINILKTDKTKPMKSDIYNGIYTAPVIFLNSDFENKEDLYKKITESKECIDLTKKLIQTYVEKAINEIDFIPNNQYKEKLIKITNELLYFS